MSETKQVTFTVGEYDDQELEAIEISLELFGAMDCATATRVLTYLCERFRATKDTAE